MARAVVLRSEARNLPLPDASVDLIVTSPPYFALRDYKDGDESLAGQIGSEATPAEYLENLLDCTAEWMRVLKPEGSMFVNLGDKYGRGTRTTNHGSNSKTAYVDGGPGTCVPTGHEKSLIGLPWRYALGCMDELGLILRRDIIWHKINGLPESANDRCRSSHEYLFHLVKQPRYYSAVDEIREPHSAGTHSGRVRTVDSESGNGVRHRTFAGNTDLFNLLGKLPGSVWEIASEPLSLPAYLGVEHYAAFPAALPRKCILGWSPPAICLECGQGRFPVADKVQREAAIAAAERQNRKQVEAHSPRGSTLGYPAAAAERKITGYACACTPYTDHPGVSREGPRNSGSGWAGATGDRDCPSGGYGNAERTGPWREYHLDGWVPPPSRPAVVLDPFGGTGTTALVAVAHGRHGISCDLSAGYCRAARWRTGDSAERVKALGMAKPPPAKRLREDLYGGISDDLDALLEESS